MRINTTQIHTCAHKKKHCLAENMIGTKTSEINELGKLLIKHASFWESEASRRRRRHASFPGPVIQLFAEKGIESFPRRNRLQPH